MRGFCQIPYVNTQCFLSLTAVALVIIEHSLGITQGPTSKRNLAPADAVGIRHTCRHWVHLPAPWGKGLWSPRAAGTGNGVWRLFPTCLSGLQPGFVSQCFLQLRQMQRHFVQAKGSIQNRHSKQHQGSWRTVKQCRSILLMSLKLAKALPAFSCVHTSSPAVEL